MEIQGETKERRSAIERQTVLCRVSRLKRAAVRRVLDARLGEVVDETLRIQVFVGFKSSRQPAVAGAPLLVGHQVENGFAYLVMVCVQFSRGRRARCANQELGDELRLGTCV